MSPLEQEDAPSSAAEMLDQVLAPENIKDAVKGANNVLKDKKKVDVLAQKGVDVAVPYVEKLRNNDTVADMDKFLTSMTPENRSKFLEIALDTSLDSTMWQRFLDTVSLVFLPWKAKRIYDNVKNGTYAALLLMGAIGTAEDQTYVAERVTPGFIENNLVKALKVIALWDPELVSKEFITAVTTAIKAKGLALEILGGTRIEMAKRQKPSVATEIAEERFDQNTATTPPGIIQS